MTTTFDAALFGAEEGVKQRGSPPKSPPRVSSPSSNSKKPKKKNPLSLLSHKVTSPSQEGSFMDGSVLSCLQGFCKHFGAWATLAYLVLSPLSYASDSLFFLISRVLLDVFFFVDAIVARLAFSDTFIVRDCRPKWDTIPLILGALPIGVILGAVTLKQKNSEWVVLLRLLL